MSFLVKFGAHWCQPCKKLDPQLAELVEEHGLEIHDVDVDEISPELTQEWGITGVPALFFHDEFGEVFHVARGAVPPHEILSTFAEAGAEEV